MGDEASVVTEYGDEWSAWAGSNSNDGMSESGEELVELMPSSIGFAMSCSVRLRAMPAEPGAPSFSGDDESITRRGFDSRS